MQTTAGANSRVRSSLFNPSILWPLAFCNPVCRGIRYPVIYGLLLGREPSTYRFLFTDPTYSQAVKNTLL